MLKFEPFLVRICMGGTLEKENAFLLLETNTKQKGQHICSTMKFIEQNFHFLILSQTLYVRSL
jgi:hypothetical protein